MVKISKYAVCFFEKFSKVCFSFGIFTIFAKVLNKTNNNMEVKKYIQEDEERF